MMASNADPPRQPSTHLQTAKYFEQMRLSFADWTTPTRQKMTSLTGKTLQGGLSPKVGRVEGRNIVILAGYDHDASRGRSAARVRSMHFSLSVS